MHGLFDALTNAVQGAPAVALGAAFAWGVLSILLSPCHLASIPLIVGLVVVMATITGMIYGAVFTPEQVR